LNFKDLRFCGAHRICKDDDPMHETEWRCQNDLVNDGTRAGSMGIEGIDDDGGFRGEATLVNMP